MTSSIEERQLADDAEFEALVAQAEFEAQNRRMEPCANCGELTHWRWCSYSCRIAEDGPQPDECLDGDR